MLWLDKMVKISTIGTELRVDLDQSHAANPIVQYRFKEIFQVMATSLRHIGVVERTINHSMRVAVSQEASATKVNETLTIMLRKIASIVHRPCTPRMVVKLLGIQSRERIRWTKDGRLKTVGKIGARHGNGFACPTYAADDIANLAAHPEIIAQWRHTDANDNGAR